VPTYLAGALRRSPAPNDVSDARKYAQMYQTPLIIRCAILEGAAFFCLVSYMLEHHLAALAAALVFADDHADAVSDEFAPRSVDRK